MIVQCGLLLLLSLSKTTGYIEKNGLILDKGFDRSSSFSHWPSFHNGANMWRIRKREIQGEVGPSEGSNHGNGPVVPSAPSDKPSPAAISNSSSVQSPTLAISDDKSKVEKPKDDPKVPSNPIQNVTENSPLPSVTHSNDTKNATVTDEQASELDLSGPGVVKRGVIVFGGFALLAVAYFIFYRRKSSKNDANTSHSAIDANQFRYGVLQSDDRRDNLELSRIPLTMESDEDEDDDLEIFDLEQKRKSMSYVNMQVNDEEVVNGPRDNSDGDRDNLLLDIEDVNTDALINWSNNGNKSIL